MFNCSPHLRLFSVCALLLSSLGAQAADRYTARMAWFSPSYKVTVTAINDKNQIGGAIQNLDNTLIPARAFYTGSSALTDVHMVAEADGYSLTAVTGMNNSGQLLGYQRDRSWGIRQDIVWQKNMRTELATIADKYQAVAINDAGLIVGNSTAPYSPRAMMWSNGVLSDLDPSDVHYMTTAIDMNAYGQVLMVARSYPMIWQGGRYRRLAFTPGTYQPPNPLAINDAAHVVGSTYGTMVNPSQPAYWPTPETLIQLNVLYDKGGIARDINNQGVIVGSSFRYNPVDLRTYEHATLWESGSSAPRLLLDLCPELKAAGWTLTQARLINKAGTIVVDGTHPQVGTRTFILQAVP